MKHYFRKEENVQINLIDANVKLRKNGCLREKKDTTCYQNNLYIYFFPPCQSGFKYLSPD